MATLPNIETSYEVAKTTDTRTLQANFGDGYTQRAADGINITKDIWQLRWIGLSSTDSDTLTDFFEARGGWEEFEWTPHGEVSAKKFICKNWNKTWNRSEECINIEAQFEQVYDLD